jgi:preprotein translocase subunit SecY
MDWSNKFLNNLGICLRKNSHIRIPIIVNTINVTQASTQTLPINFNNNNSMNIFYYYIIDFFFLLVEDRHKTRRRKYQHRFNKCLAELIEKYPPIPAHEHLVCLILYLIKFFLVCFFFFDRKKIKKSILLFG